MSPTFQQLLRRYDRPCLTLDEVRAEWFPHIQQEKSLLRAIREGRIGLRYTTLQPGRYTTRVVYLHDLATWLDSRDPRNQSNQTAAEQAA